MSVFTSRVTTADWRHDAVCNQVDPDLFFPEIGQRHDAAKAVCAGCPALRPCRDWGLDRREPYGIWGGLGPEDRAQILAAAHQQGERIDQAGPVAA